MRIPNAKEGNEATGGMHEVGENRSVAAGGQQRGSLETRFVREMWLGVKHG